MRHPVFVTRRLPGAALDRLALRCDVDLWPEETPPPRAEILARAGRAHGLLCLLTDRVDGDVLAAGQSLEVVSNFAVGYDNIDVAAATARGIPVGNTPGVLTEATADLAFALLLGAARRITEGAAVCRDGRFLAWSPTLLLGAGVHGATLGIVGMGRIGRAVARRAAGFAMEVLYCDEAQDRASADVPARKVPFDELLGASDFVSLHAPLTPATRGLMDRRAFSLMKRTAILVNTARGPLVDHDALYDALVSSRIAAAALDVTDPEPLPPGHRLLGLESCLIVPHLGSATVATRSRMAEMAVDNLLAGLSGARLPHCVNPEVYER